jgi:hypothetical protein
MEFDNQVACDPRAQHLRYYLRLQAVPPPRSTETPGALLQERVGLRCAGIGSLAGDGRLPLTLATEPPRFYVVHFEA